MNLAASFSPRMEHAASQSICSMGLVSGTDACRLPDRRRVTLAADSASSMANSVISTPASVASAAMAVRAAFWGIVTPPSHRFTVANDTPRRSASCSCVRSSLARMACRVGGIVCWSAIFVMVSVRYAGSVREPLGVRLYIDHW